jgi:hypothetical protein
MYPLGFHSGSMGCVSPMRFVARHFNSTAPLFEGVHANVHGRKE